MTASYSDSKPNTMMYKACTLEIEIGDKTRRLCAYLKYCATQLSLINFYAAFKIYDIAPTESEKGNELFILQHESVDHCNSHNETYLVLPYEWRPRAYRPPYLIWLILLHLDVALAMESIEKTDAWFLAIIKVGREIEASTTGMGLSQTSKFEGKHW